MSRASRRVPPPAVPQQVYSSVPQSPSRSASYSQRSGVPYSPPPASQRSAPRSTYTYTYTPQSQPAAPLPGPEETAANVQTGAIGSDYGPYSYHPGGVRGEIYREGHFSNAPSEVSSMTGHEKAAATATTVTPYFWDSKDPDLDDPMHNPDPVREALLDRQFTLFSARGWANATVLVTLVVGLLTLFVGYPIIADVNRHVVDVGGFNLGGINGSGQVPVFEHFPSLIDADTPDSAQTKTGEDGNSYHLVFSDEFTQDGRSFYPGDDPYWEAVDLQYWATGDLEWYDPSAVTTKNGKLVITMTETPNHNLNFMSGMVTTWNKWCFTTGIIEVSVSLPGDAQTPGFWPAVWTMGNLGRAGYGATTEGMWPYTYDTCDVGTFPNQTDAQGNPTVDATGGTNGLPLSYLPGQRLSACTCPGSDHPGPDVGTGRGVPEIDVFEAQIDVSLRQGAVSQSYQIAPYNYQYAFNNQTPATTIFDDSITHFNNYQGGVYQQAVSGVTLIDSQNYNGNGFGTYGFEWWSDPKHRDQGYITWYSDGKPSWQITSASIGPDPTSKISQRLISEEPHYIIMNLGMSPSFQQQDFKNLKFPATMQIDYVRVYQKDGVKNVGCNPSKYPTTDYINNHLNAYMNPNLTTWDQANYTFPRNSLYDKC